MLDRKVIYVVLTLVAFQPSTGRGAQDDAMAEPSSHSIVQAANDALDRIEDVEDADRRQSLLDEARQQVEALQAQDPASPWIAYLRGRTLAMVGRQGDAIEQLERFVDTREGRSEWKAYRLLGDLLVREFPRLARSNYRKAAALKDNDAATTFGLSVCAAKLGATADAIELATRAISLDANQSVSYVAHLATLLRRAGRYEDAIREAGAALELAKDEARQRPSRQSLRALHDHYGLLIATIEEQLSAAETVESDGYVRMATLLKERGGVSAKLSRHQAIAALEAGVERLGAEAPAKLLERYGTELAVVDRTDDAIAVFERLLEIDPDNHVAKELLPKLKAAIGP